MSNKAADPRNQPKINDQTTSDVIIRLKTDQGRDDWIYTHSQILSQKSHFFASRLSSRTTPPSQIEIHCHETEVNAHIIILRQLYSRETDISYGVKNTLIILQVADRLGFEEIAGACMACLEAACWDEEEEEEIIKFIPMLGPRYSQVLSRLLPVDPPIISNLFISALSIATVSPPPSSELKRSAQEQLEYMLTEDDDSPIVNANDQLVKAKVRESVGDLLIKMDKELSQISHFIEIDDLSSLLSDICWLIQILSKMEMMKELVWYWVDRSAAIAAVVEGLPIVIGRFEIRIKTAEIVLKILETVSCGSVILPAIGRLGLIRVWLPFVQKTRTMVEEEGFEVEKVGDELWKGLESVFVMVLLTLPSGDLAGILTSWLRGGKVGYPDLTEVFEVWCFRAKAGRRRFGMDGRSCSGDI